MKALSIRQPWADLILHGKKTLELRNWLVNYRGPLAIHASQTVEETACRTHGIDPKKVSTGVVLGVVELKDIQTLDESTYYANGQEHLSTAPFKAPLFGWMLTNPKILDQPFPFTGHMGLFNVPDGLLLADPANNEKGEELIEEESVSLDSRLPFELQVKPEPGSHPSLASYRLALYQRPVVPQAAQPGFSQIAPPKRRLVCEIGGTALKAVADAVLEALRLNRYAPTDLGVKRREPFHLTEESGVRLALIFMAIRPIAKVSRIEEISRGIRAMTGEEMYYWFAKCTTNGGAERALKALRILLSEE